MAIGGGRGRSLLVDVLDYCSGETKTKLKRGKYASRLGSSQ